MHLIQPLLLVAFLIALVVYLRFLRSSLRDRLLGLFFFGIACAAVLVPDSTQRVADLVGVGRGTDLTFYLFAVGFVFFAVLMVSKLSRLNRSLTEVVRRVAIIEAEPTGTEHPRSLGMDQPAGPDRTRL
ncbi:MAG TPA: DUF2304 domain-containing protein [Gemmatimonadales bacterium]|jgi:hypothetical protein|nr:DUF2304 domain-containing protein [Gemmatimonadales bacterium]